MSDPLKIGIGLREPHIVDVMKTQPPIDWLEVHSENYFLPTLVDVQILKRLREKYDISLHGVGISLGSVEEPEKAHLKRLKVLHDEIEPFLVSDHLSWSATGGMHVPDLLPIPYTDEAIKLFVRNIEIVQDTLGRQILVENPTSYATYKSSIYEEASFLVEICKQAKAKILLDVNNVYVSCKNHGWDQDRYLESIPEELVGEIHMAGHSVRKLSDGSEVLIDTHSAEPLEEVWIQYGKALKRFGNVPSLIEWDNEIPELKKLIALAKRFKRYTT